MTSQHTWILLAAVAVAVLGYCHAVTVEASKTDPTEKCGNFSFTCNIRKTREEALESTTLKLNINPKARRPGQVDKTDTCRTGQRQQFKEMLTIRLNSDLSYRDTIRMKNDDYNFGRLNMSYVNQSEFSHSFKFKIHNIRWGTDITLLTANCYQCALSYVKDSTATTITDGELVGLIAEPKEIYCRTQIGGCYKNTDYKDAPDHYIKEFECFNCTCNGSKKVYQCKKIICPKCVQPGDNPPPACCNVHTTCSTTKAGELETSSIKDDSTVADLTTMESTTTESTTTESDLPLPTWAIGAIVAGVVVMLIIAGFIMCCCFCGKQSKDGNAINITMSAPPPQILPATPSQVDNSDLKFRSSQMINPDIVRASMMMGSMMGSQILNPSMLPQNMPQDNFRGSLMMGSQMMNPGMFPQMMPQDNFRGSQMMSPGQFSDFGSQQNRFSMSSRMGGLY